MSGLSESLFVHLLAFGLSTLALGYCAYEQEWLWIGFAALSFVFSVQQLIQFYDRNSRKVSTVLDAIDNDDFAIQYPINPLFSNDMMVNNALNRIVQVLHQAKTDAIQKEKYYELILNSVSTGVVVLEASGAVFQSNHEAHRLLGLNVFTHVKQLHYVDETLLRVVEQIGKGDKEQVSFINERGTVNLSIRASEMILREKHVRILAINDINSELDEKEIDSWIRLTRVLTHEIMNSVTPIASMSETMLSLEEVGNGKIHDGLEVINTTCNGLLSFVDSYRRFTHIPTPKPTLFYVSKLLERMTYLSRHQNDFPNIVIRYSLVPEDLIVYADENLVSQVILNLLRNAMQAIGNEQPDGEIEMKAYCTDTESVVLEVSNNGPAISTDEAQHIFIPFFTTKEGGSGIGLSISRQIMRLSGGSLSLKSTPGAPHTTFMLIFP